MPGSLLITAIALALTCGLLRLRHSLVTCSKEPQPSYRAYAMWFAETDEYADGDDDVREDAEDAHEDVEDVHEDAGTDDILALWPAELVGSARHLPRPYGHYEDDGWASRDGSDIAAFPLPGRSLVPAHQPAKFLSQTTYHCPTCGQYAWAPPTAQLLCGLCKRPMPAYL